MDEGSTKPFLPPYSHYEAPCLYMEYIDGMTANSRLNESGDVQIWVVRYLLWQLAKASAEMLSKEVPAAGDVGIDSETGRITILPGGASDGPAISSVKEFYHHKCKELEEQHGHANIPDSRSLANKFPALYKLLAPDDYFCLSNENLGFHKIIVDETWKITAMIDLDCVRAVPWTWAIRPMYRSMVDVIPDPLLSNDIMARAYEVQMRDDYCFWLQELHRFLCGQNNHRLCRALEQYVGSGGAALTTGLADCGKYGPGWDAEWLKEWASLESRLNPAWALDKHLEDIGSLSICYYGVNVTVSHHVVILWL